MSNVHIVIPIFNNWDGCHSLLWDLQRREKNNISSILLVDDCSTDPEVAGGIKWWTSEYGSPFLIDHVHLGENVGFLEASNIGIAMTGLKNPTKEDIIILMSTDVRVQMEFIPQVTEILQYPKKLVGGILYTNSTGWNKFGDRIFQYLEGWLLATTSQNWAELGMFDRQFMPNDFEDMDLSTRALEMGYELIPLNNPGLQHIGAQSIGYNDRRLEITNKNKKKFQEKWCKDG